MNQDQVTSGATYGPVPHLKIVHLRTSYEGLRAGDPRAEARLLASLAREGQKVPIVVATEEDGGHEVIGGCRQIRGLKQLKEEIVDAVDWPTGAADALRELQPGQPRGGATALIEEGHLIATLVDRNGLNLADLAIRLQGSRTGRNAEAGIDHRLWPSRNVGNLGVGTRTDCLRC